MQKGITITTVGIKLDDKECFNEFVDAVQDFFNSYPEKMEAMEDMVRRGSDIEALLLTRAMSGLHSIAALVRPQIFQTVWYAVELGYLIGKYPEKVDKFRARLIEKYGSREITKIIGTKDSEV